MIKTELINVLKTLINDKNECNKIAEKALFWHKRDNKQRYIGSYKPIPLETSAIARKHTLVDICYEYLNLNLKGKNND